MFFKNLYDSFSDTASPRLRQAKSLWALERARSARSRCRACSRVISKDETRLVELVRVLSVSRKLFYCTDCHQSRETLRNRVRVQ